MALADSRTFCTAGNKSPISIAIMAITTSNSISVNAPPRSFKEVFNGNLQKED